MVTESNKKPKLPERYALHRVALHPWGLETGTEELAGLIRQIRDLGEARFILFILQQGLGSLWFDTLKRHRAEHHLSNSSIEQLHQYKLAQTGQYLLQRHNVQLASEILKAADVAHAFIKGSITRELYYDEPSSRPAADIDILVLPEDKIKAIKEFEKSGFVFQALAANVSHECSLVKGLLTIDLHWDIMRPGRTRVPLTRLFLGERVKYGDVWGLTHSANLYLMLTHSVFTKYSTTPHAKLVRLMDLITLIERHPKSVDDTIVLMQQTGTATAGWITATWLGLLSECVASRSIANRLRPGKIKQKYLQAWLNRNLSTKLLNKPTLVQLGFTLPAHDSWSDAGRALHKAIKFRMHSKADLLRLKQSLLELQ